MDELLRNIRYMCSKAFKDCQTEQELNNKYEELRQEMVCAMSERAEELGIDPDSL